MAFTLESGLKQSQKLVMTQSLRQAIELLQLSSIELSQKISNELLENPVLEESQLEPPQDQAESSSTEEERNPFDEIDYEAYFADAEASAPPRSLQDPGRELPTFESTLTKTTDLPTHLTWQLDLSTSSETIKAVGRAIIGNINEDGYLKASLEEKPQQ